MKNMLYTKQIILKQISSRLQKEVSLNVKTQIFQEEWSIRGSSLHYIVNKVSYYYINNFPNDSTENNVIGSYFVILQLINMNLSITWTLKKKEKEDIST